MEWAAKLAGEPHSDRPQCVDPAICGFMIRLNDWMDDKQGQALKPYVLRSLGTAGDARRTVTRAMMLADWVVRTVAPRVLHHAGLAAEANELASLDAIIDAKTATNAHSSASALISAATNILDLTLYVAAGGGAIAAYSVATIAAYSVAAIAAYNAARATAYSVADAADAAAAAVQSAENAIEVDATTAGVTGGAIKGAEKEWLIKSALELLRRMIEVGK